jgi:tetratricopeptide (TPR) repeat protein
MPVLQKPRNAFAHAGALLPIVCCFSALIGCSTLAGGDRSSGLRVEPVLSIRDSSGPSARKHSQLGRYYQGQNRLEQAAQSYRKALEADIRYVDARSALGAVYASQGKFDEAISEFEAALKMAPELASLYNNLGYAHFLQGKHPDAIDAFGKATRLEPNNPRTLNNLGAAYARAGETGKSNAAFARARELSARGALAAAESVEDKHSLPALIAGSAVPLERIVAASVDLTAGPGDAPANASVAIAEPGRHVPDAAGGQEKRSAPAESAQTTASGPAAEEPDAAPPARKTFSFEIANGNGVTGMAKGVGSTLVKNGLPTPRLTNLKPYQQRQTVIEYRDGYYREALILWRKLERRPLLSNVAARRNNPDVRLILGRDTRIAQNAIANNG